MPESTLARLTDSPAADRAKEELELHLAARAELLLASAGRAMARLHAAADGDSPALEALALDVARGIRRGQGPLRAVVAAALKRARGRGGPAARGRPTVILEAVDVGVPVKEAYARWTRHRECPDSVRVADARIAWTCPGVTGATRGVVTFHGLGADLTRVLLVIEYHPQGILAKTATLWDAEGRRVRRGLREYARMLAVRADDGPGEAEDEGGSV
ncbi:cyclase/dehydrase [Streptomyces sp. NPDC091268]|uniref:cyclase/dehydrase n=1 Tax=Streptomyces sp. NPDC091268 TaxID=3365979 RepID=UPI00382B9A21